MFYRLDNENKIKDCSEEKYADDCLFTDKEISRDFTGQLVFTDYLQTNEYKKALLEHKEKQEIGILRYKRSEECFSVVNRGSLWYDTLTETQKQELKVWYNAWLDVTETKIIPDKPSWLK